MSMVGREFGGARRRQPDGSVTVAVTHGTVADFADGGSVSFSSTLLSRIR